MFVTAQGVIEGDSLFISHPSVSKPVAVRCGWGEIAQPNLINKEGLPACPFRSDNWPVD